MEPLEQVSLSQGIGTRSLFSLFYLQFLPSNVVSF